MRLLYDNLIDYAGVVLTPSTETTTLPAVNVINELRGKVWRTLATQATETLLIDLGSAKTAKALILLDHTLTASDTTIKLEGNFTSDFSSPDFTTAITYAANVITKAFTANPYQFWRISFTKSSAGVTRDIGRVFLGSYYDTLEQPDYSGYQRGAQDLSVQQRTNGGQVYTDKRPQFRKLKYDFSQLNATDVNQLVAIMKSMGEAVSFFVITDTSGTSELAETIYVKFAKLAEPKVSGFDSDLTWDLKIELDEQL